MCALVTAAMEGTAVIPAAMVKDLMEVTGGKGMKEVMAEPGVKVRH